MPGPCNRRGGDYLLLEASDRIGGRVKTDLVDGFLLNRGFQVLHTAYLEARRLLDYEALDLRSFAPGAVFRIGGRPHAVADPLRAPRHLMDTLAAPIGTWGDRLRIARLALRLARRRPEELFAAPDTLAQAFLRREGFSEVMIRLMDWYGEAVDRWELLRIYWITHALPDQPPPTPNPTRAVGELCPGLFVCGGYGSLPSIQCALLSGRLAAEAVSARSA